VIDKKEQLLDAAEELFSEHGFEGTTTRMLAKESGMNIAMVSYYFGSKEKLFEALVESRAGALRDKLITINEREIDAWEKIELIIDYYVDKIFSNRCFHRILHREMTLQQRPELNENISKILAKNRNEVIKIIKEGQKNGDFKQVDAEYTMASLVGTISHIVHVSGIDLLSASSINKSAEEKMKVRLKKHLRELLKAHLCID